MFKFILIMIFIKIILIPSMGWSCSCITPSPPPEALKHADYVIAGQAVECIEPGSQPLIVECDTTKRYWEIEVVRWRIAVICVWKGSVQDTLEIYTERAMCGYHFEVGELYLIYGYVKEAPKTSTRRRFLWPGDTVFPVIETNLCTRTKKWETAFEDLEELPEPFCKD